MADSDTQTPAPMGWHVTSQAERTTLGPDGRPQQSVAVGFTTDDGTTGTVLVPQSQYNAPNVKAAIAAKVATMSDVANLHG